MDNSSSENNKLIATLCDILDLTTEGAQAPELIREQRNLRREYTHPNDTKGIIRRGVDFASDILLARLYVSTDFEDEEKLTLDKFELITETRELLMNHGLTLTPFTEGLKTPPQPSWSLPWEEYNTNIPQTEQTSITTIKETQTKDTPQLNSSSSSNNNRNTQNMTPSNSDNRRNEKDTTKDFRQTVEAITGHHWRRRGLTFMCQWLGYDIETEEAAEMVIGATQPLRQYLKSCSKRSSATILRKHPELGIALKK